MSSGIFLEFSLVLLTIFVSGGVGYVGSRALVNLVATGLTILILDNLSNSVELCWASLK